MKKVIYLSLIMLVFFLITEFNKQPDFHINEALVKTEESMNALSEIKETIHARNGNKIRFRLVVREYPTSEEATELFKEVLNNVQKYSAHSGVWNYFEGDLDILSEDGDVIYVAAKRLDEDLSVKKSGD